MKIAALYDIHGNAPALEAVLAEVDRLNVDALVIGGDTIGGPLPVATLDILQQVTVPKHFIHGNGESDVLRFLQSGVPGGLTENADNSARWVAAQLSAEQRAFIATWLLSVTLDVDGVGKVLFCHANPQDDITVFTEQTADKRVREVLGDFSAETIICGHTHMQFDRTVDNVRIVNAGSVGMPFGVQGAHWLLLNDGDIQLMRTEYDYEQAAARICTSNYPTAAAFAEGNILSVPPAEAAFGFLSAIESQQMK